VLGGYSSALLLAVVAAMMLFESLARLVSPRPIQFSQAIVVACVGLAMNLISAWLLNHGEHSHHHDGHDHDHDSHHEHHHDINLPPLTSM
jgi:Co/Zn/Cd efflux system component